MIVRIPDRIWAEMVSAVASYEKALREESYIYISEETAHWSGKLMEVFSQAIDRGEVQSERED